MKLRIGTAAACCIVLLVACQSKTSGSSDDAGGDQAMTADACVEEETGLGFFIFFLKDGWLTPFEAAEMELDELELENDPVLTIDDIASYHWETHTITLAPGADWKARTAPSVFPAWRPFVAVAQGERQYFGAHLSLFSSWTFCHPVILDDKRVFGDSNMMGIFCGYPLLEDHCDGCSIDGSDPRDNPAIRQVLEKACKLAAE